MKKILKILEVKSRTGIYTYLG